MRIEEEKDAIKSGSVAMLGGASGEVCDRGKLASIDHYEQP